MRILLLMLLVGLAACSTPLPVAEFGDKASDPKITEYAKRGAPVGDVSTFDKVRDAMIAYDRLYMEAADRMRIRAQTSSETTFFSSILAVIGGLAKSQETVIAGGLGATGAGLYSERYRLTVQAENYEMAASALSCMHMLLPDSKTSELRSYKFRSTDQPVDTAFRSAALESLMHVRERLRRLQATFQLGQPDVNKLKDIVKRSDDVVDKDDTQFRLFMAEPGAKQPATQEAIEKYRNDLKLCEAKFTS